MGTLRRIILLTLFKVFDQAVLVASFIAAAVPRLRQYGALSLEQFLSMRVSVHNLVLFALLLLSWYSIFSFYGLYQSKRLTGRRFESLDVLKATTMCTLLFILVGSLFKLRIAEPVFFVVFWLSSTVAVVLSRSLLRQLLARIRRRGRNLRHVVIVGTNSRALEFAKTLEALPDLGYSVLGFVDTPWLGMDKILKTGRRGICDLEGFLSFLRTNVVDEVVIALPIKSFYREASEIAGLCLEQGITTHILSDLFDFIPGRKKTEHDSLITVHAGAPQGAGMVFKRAFDIVGSLICILLFSPLLLFAAAMIKLTSPGPVLFSQKRVGLNKRVISVYKFRTMVPDAENLQKSLESRNEVTGPVFKIKNDPRITPIGRFLRKTSIDELPQLFNVFKGDMSLVGPRPLPLLDYAGFEKDWQRRRLCIRPGITCLWQVSGRSSVQFDRWMELDMEYIDGWSLWLDCKILIRTIPAVLRGSGAV